MASELQNGLEKLTNQARFVQMIVDKQLVVSNRKKADIVIDLRKHEFRPFPKASRKAAGTEEGADDEDEGDDDDADVRGAAKGGKEAGDYDYLLGMAIYSLTKEKIERLKAMAVEKEQELLRLLEKTPKSMWNEDLDRFMEEWEVCCCIVGSSVDHLIPE